MPRSIRPPLPPRVIVPALPNLLDRKLYKTGQTRGADDDVIYQNRVLRNNTVLIPYALWEVASKPPQNETAFENGYIVLLSPDEYFDIPTIADDLKAKNLALGTNALVFYETRSQWNAHPPDRLGWTAALQRSAPLGGQYVARVPANTGQDGGRINLGYNTTNPKGAGIRVFEYASSSAIAACRLQLEFLFWHCLDASEVATTQGMSVAQISARRDHNAAKCAEHSLNDLDKLIERRLLNDNSKTMCPLCLEEVSAQGFFSKVEQAEGRLVPDLTVTQLNLFHIEELRIGVFGHRPYNLGWGHHHCNVVVKDSGIAQTVTWMAEVVDRNVAAGYLITGDPRDPAAAGIIPPLE